MSYIIKTYEKILLLEIDKLIKGVSNGCVCFYVPVNDIIVKHTLLEALRYFKYNVEKVILRNYYISGDENSQNCVETFPCDKYDEVYYTDMASSDYVKLFNAINLTSSWENLF